MVLLFFSKLQVVCLYIGGGSLFNKVSPLLVFFEALVISMCHKSLIVQKSSNLNKSLQVHPNLTQNSSSKFRISAKRIFLTYSDVNEVITKEDVLNALKTKLSFSGYVVSQERHKSSSKHFHVVLEHSSKFNIHSITTLCLNINNSELKGHYKAVINLKGVVSYTIKEGDYITNIDINKSSMKVASKHLKLHEEILKKGFRQAVYEESKRDPVFVVQNLIKLERNYKSYEKFSDSFKSNTNVDTLDKLTTALPEKLVH
jgi:hypothetical protein